MKKLTLRAAKTHQLQAQAAKKTAWLKARGVDRVLIVYDKQTACLYREQPLSKP